MLLVEAGVDDALRTAAQANPANPGAALPGPLAERLAAGIGRRLAQHRAAAPAATPVLVAAPDTRRHLRTLLARHGIDAPVLSHAELTPEFSTHVLGTLALPAADAPEPAPAARPLRAVPPRAA